MRNAEGYSHGIKSGLALILSSLLVGLPIHAEQAQTPPPPAAAPAPQQPVPQVKPVAPLPVVQDLRLLVLAGNGEMNDLERRVMAPLVVQILDQNDRPVQGAEVIFRFPLNGPSATFTGGKTSQTVRSNGTGEAAAVNWMANGQVGSFEVHVNATYGNEVGETTLRMSNVTRIVQSTKAPGVVVSQPGGAQSHWYSPKWVKIALIAGVAAAAAGIAIAVSGGGSSAASSKPPITITPGPPSVGGPH